MRILQINKFFHVRGGADSIFLNTCALLAEHGHEVGHFSTQHRKNLPSPQEKYFVSGGFAEDDVDQLSLARKAGAFFEGIYNRQAYRNLRALVRDFRPDLAHAHNINYQLSPSIFDALADEGVPSVMTMHDYSVVCGAGTLFVDGKICERCRGGRHYNGTLHRCFHGSLPASSMATLNKYVHGARRTMDKVARFISPSRFLREKLIEFVFAAERVSHLPNFIDFSADGPVSGDREDYVLYFGRFSSNKGVGILPDAAERAGVRLVMVGHGPLQGELEARAASSGGQCRVLPFTSSREELRGLIARSLVVVVPSAWYENQPGAILESYANSRPVVAARLGGIPELVEEQGTGLLFEAGNVADLAEKLRYVAANPQLADAWGEAGRCRVRRDFSRESHYRGLLEIYRSVAARPLPVAGV